MCLQCWPPVNCPMPDVSCRKHFDPKCCYYSVYCHMQYFLVMIRIAKCFTKAANEFDVHVSFISFCILQFLSTTLPKFIRPISYHEHHLCIKIQTICQNPTSLPRHQNHRHLDFLCMYDVTELVY